MRRAVQLLSVLVALSAASCAHESAQSRAAPASPAEAAQRSTVGAATTFEARLDTPLSSETAKSGDRVRAHLDHPLVAGDGVVIAPRGTRLVGRVLEVERGGMNRIALQLDGIVLSGRVYRIYAQVVRIDAARVVVSDVADPDSLQADVYPPLPAELDSLDATGGGPAPEIVPLAVPREARIRLVLTRPFALPSATSTVEVQDSGEVDRTFE